MRGFGMAVATSIDEQHLETLAAEFSDLLLRPERDRPPGDLETAEMDEPEEYAQRVARRPLPSTIQ
jgi:hypothetical protein